MYFWNQSWCWFHKPSTATEEIYFFNRGQAWQSHSGPEAAGMAIPRLVLAQNKCHNIRQKATMESQVAPLAPRSDVSMSLLCESQEGGARDKDSRWNVSLPWWSLPWVLGDPTLLQKLVTHFPIRKQLCQEDTLCSLIHSILISRLPDMCHCADIVIIPIGWQPRNRHWDVLIWLMPHIKWYLPTGGKKKKE